MPEAKQQAVIILSGGMDSTTLLCFLKHQNYEVFGLSFDYGQRHAKELEFAAYWGQKECKLWRKIDISFLKELGSHSALLNPEINMPQVHYSDDSQRITVVPNRNMIMLSIAAGWAENLGISQVYFAPHSNDRSVYPDCRPEFVEALTQATQLATYQHVQILAPFANITKAKIAEIGHGLGLDFSKTWSCYQGRQYHCGQCGTCQERREAFAQANLQDPTVYEKVQ